MRGKSIPLLLACAVAVGACSDTETLAPPAAQQVPIDDLLDGPIQVELDPSGLTPLAAEATFQTKIPVAVAIKVLGAEPLHHAMPGVSTYHTVPILGLYAGTDNAIEVRLTNGDESFAVDTITVTTDPLPDFLPTIEIVTADGRRMEGGWTFSNLGIGVGGHFSSWPLMFDRKGDIRWFLRLSFLDDLAFVVKRSRDGNLLFAEGPVIYEYDMLGRQLRRWDTPGYHQHHDLLEMADGNLIGAVDVTGRATIEDQIIQVDRQSGAIVREWDMRTILDVYRRTFINNAADWFHMNAVFRDEANGALIVSGRNQASVIKVTDANELVWILAAHKGWGLAGVNADGHNTADFLLTAVDAAGVPYPDSVQQGDIDAPDFAWPWGQHAAMLLPNGHVFLFDNGVTRNFDADANPFSRGVEYEIDEAARTVRQVWQYGKERGPDYYSSIISDVDLLPTTGNRLIMPGIVRGADPRAYVTEVTYPSGDVVFEAVLHLKQLLSSGTFGWGQFDLVYRSERMFPYPP